MRRHSKGQVLVLFALMLFVLLGFAALAVDVGYMYTVRHELQRCADAGALAGASAFQTGTWDNASLSSPTMVEADRRARDYASRDAVATARLDPAAEVAVFFDRGQDRIRVDTSRTVNLFFARVLGHENAAITASAVAEAAVVDLGVKCLKPWGIPIPWEDANGNLQYDEGETVLDLDALTPGYEIVLKVGEPFNNPGNLDNITALQQEAGHFFALELCDDSGGNDYRNRIASPCLDGCSISEGDPVNLKTGNTVGPTKQGVDQLIAMDPYATFVEGSSPPTVTGSSYSDWTQSPRLVKIPLYDPSELLRQGNTDMHVAAFGGFWLKGYDTTQGTVIGYYIPNAATGGSGNTGPSPGPFLKTLRLVE
jgi:hypothetical protein